MPWCVMNMDDGWTSGELSKFKWRQNYQARLHGLPELRYQTIDMPRHPLAMRNEEQLNRLARDGVQAAGTMSHMNRGQRVCDYPSYLRDAMSLYR